MTTYWQILGGDWRELLLPALVPVFALALVLEGWVLHRQGQRLDLGDSATNIGLGLTYLVLESLAKLVLIIPVGLWVYQWRWFDIPVTVWTILPVFLGLEFFYYWFHRASHRVRWFWSAHVVHHSGEQMNLSTSLRQGFLYSVTGWWLLFLPLMWLGVHPLWVLFLYSCNLGYQFFIHTEVVRQLPRWVEYWFNTPSHHRVHHGRNARYLDCNYGGVVIVFDRWFGSFVAEEEPAQYGVIHPPLRPRNLWRVNVDEFVAMWRDAARPGPWAQRLRHFWAPPGYERPIPGDHQPTPLAGNAPPRRPKSAAVVRVSPDRQS